MRVVHTPSVVHGGDSQGPQPNDELFVGTREQKSSQAGVARAEVLVEETFEQRGENRFSAVGRTRDQHRRVGFVALIAFVVCPSLVGPLFEEWNPADARKQEDHEDR